jgi:hypothetical protein
MFEDGMGSALAGDVDNDDYDDGDDDDVMMML